MAKIIVEYVHISELKEWPDNPRRHDVEAIRKSMERFGVRWPIIVNRQRMQVEAGHGRLKALRELGETQVPVIFVDDDEVTAKAFSIADNRTQELTEWDEAGLVDILTELKAAGELEPTAFFVDDLNELLRQLGRFEGETFDVEAAMEAAPDQVANTKPGDIWQLGRHRLMCGDSRKAKDIERLMAGERARLVVTDPPYGVAYDGSGSNPRWPKDGSIIANDDLGKDQFAFWVAAFTTVARVVSGDVYIFAPSGPLNMVLAEAIQKAGIEHHQWLIWCKNRFVLGRSHYHYRHEHIFYGWHRESSWNGSREEDSVWECPNPMNSPEHPTMKPVELIIKAFKNSSKEKDGVLDPFLGSGTTIIAAEQTGRICFGMEIVPHYCDVAIARWEAYTGEQAILVEEREMVYA